MTEAEKHRRTLIEVSWNNQFIWPQEFTSSAKWALAEIERLTQENAALKSKLEKLIGFIPPEDGKPRQIK